MSTLDAPPRRRSLAEEAAAQPPHWREDPFFAQYFARIDRETADSFSPQQRAALKLMFAGRAPGRHWIDLRRSVPLLGRRIYLVLLVGRERRSAERLRREGMISRTGDALAYVLTLTLLLMPFAAFLYLAKSALGLDLIGGGGLHAALEAAQTQFELLFGL
jgi:hypothetical protein